MQSTKSTVKRLPRVEGKALVSLDPGAPYPGRCAIRWKIPLTLGFCCSDIGANPSAEEAEEGLEEGTKQVIDVVDAFRLNFLGDEASGTRLYGTKKDYMSQLKSKRTGWNPLDMH